MRDVSVEKRRRGELSHRQDAQEAGIILPEPDNSLRILIPISPSSKRNPTVGPSLTSASLSRVDLKWLFYHNFRRNSHSLPPQGSSWLQGRVCVSPEQWRQPETMADGAETPLAPPDGGAQFKAGESVAHGSLGKIAKLLARCFNSSQRVNERTERARLEHDRVVVPAGHFDFVTGWIRDVPGCAVCPPNRPTIENV